MPRVMRFFRGSAHSPPLARLLPRPRMNVLAAHLGAPEPARLRSRAQSFVDYATAHLADSDTLAFARIQALLLQADGLHALLTHTEETEPAMIAGDFGTPPASGLLALGVGAAAELGRGLLSTRPSREWARIRRHLGAGS